MARWLSWLERRPVTAEVVGSSPIRVVFYCHFWGLSSAGRASALQAEGHRFESCRPHLFIISYFAGVAELADAQDLKSCGTYLPYRFDSGCRHEKIQHCKSWIFFRLTGNFRSSSNKNAPRGSHCGGKENAVFAARPGRRILRNRIPFYSREWGKCDD